MLHCGLAVVSLKIENGVTEWDRHDAREISHSYKVKFSCQNCLTPLKVKS